MSRMSDDFSNLNGTKAHCKSFSVMKRWIIIKPKNNNKLYNKMQSHGYKIYNGNRKLNNMLVTKRGFFNKSDNRMTIDAFK